MYYSCTTRFFLAFETLAVCHELPSYALHRFSLVITVRISDIFRWNVSVLVAVFLLVPNCLILDARGVKSSESSLLGPRARVTTYKAVVCCRKVRAALPRPHFPAGSCRGLAQQVKRIGRARQQAATALRFANSHARLRATFWQLVAVPGAAD